MYSGIAFDNPGFSCLDPRDLTVVDRGGLALADRSAQRILL